MVSRFFSSLGDHNVTLISRESIFVTLRLGNADVARTTGAAVSCDCLVTDFEQSDSARLCLRICTGPLFPSVHHRTLLVTSGKAERCVWGCDWGVVLHSRTPRAEPEEKDRS